MVTRREELEQLDKEALIEGYLLLEKRLASLEQQFANLKEALGIKPAKSSQNSSLPPSRDQKANLKKEKKAKVGARKGHLGKGREKQKPDEILDARLENCVTCGKDLRLVKQSLLSAQQVCDLPKFLPIVRELRRYGCCCPECGTYQRAKAPVGFERGRVFGRHLESLVVYLHHAHPLSYQRVQKILQEVYGLRISLGALVNLLKRGAKSLQNAATQINKAVQKAPVIGSDETGLRVAGQNHWQWVFQTEKLAYYHVATSRSAQVLRDVMGDAKPEVWVSDVLSSQMTHPAQNYQICLAHQLRDLQYLIDSQDCSWAKAVFDLFQAAIHLQHCRVRLSAKKFELFRQAYDWDLDRLLAQDPISEDSQRLWRRFHKHRRALFLFLERTDVPPTNNASEQALRNSVIYRKVTGGFRTPWGAEVYAHSLSILETARRQGHAIFDTLKFVLAPQPDFSWIGE